MRIASRLAVIAVAGLGLAATVPAATSLAQPAQAVAQGAAASAPRTSGRSPGGGTTTRLWLARYDGLGHGASGLAAAVSPDGSTVYVAGVLDTTFGTGNAAAVVAYNTATGARLWTVRFAGGGASRGSQFDHVAVSPDGSTVFAAGYNAPKGASQDQYLTAAVNAATGATRWANSSGTTGQAGSMTLSPDAATVFVTGSGGTIAYSAATGATVWTTRDDVISGFAAAASPEGSAVFVAGFTSGTPGIAAYNATSGATVWTASTTDVQIAAIAISPDGSKVFVTGTANGTTGRGSNTEAYSTTTGATLWTSATDVVPDLSPGADGMAVSPDGTKVFITGTVNGTGRLEKYYGTAALSAATGTRSWESRYPVTKPPLGGAAISIAVSPDGSKVFATGSTPGTKQANYTGYGTVAYNATTGARLWAALEHGAFAGFAHAVAVSPDGSKVFVTGEIETAQPTSKPILTTVAYGS
jgi:sugar lactone lactonase YvrE